MHTSTAAGSLPAVEKQVSNTLSVRSVGLSPADFRKGRTEDTINVYYTCT